MNQCRTCQDYLVAENARYCSSECRDIDSRLAFTRNGLILVSFLVLTYTLVAVSSQINAVYSVMAISGMLLLVLFPLYQYYQSMLIERRLKVNYKKTRYHQLKESASQPVYIYLYINRHTERIYPEDDFSEFT